MPAAQTYTERANELVALIQGVAGAGIVHNRFRWAGNAWDKFLELFKDTNQGQPGPIRGWEMSRADGDPAGVLWTETWKLMHYLSFSDADASELDFQEHLNAVVRLFRGPAARLTWGAIPDGLKITTAEPRMFGGVLCHYAECELVVVVEYDQL